MIHINKGNAVLKARVCLFQNEPSGSRFQFGSPQLMQSYSGTMAPWWQRPIARWNDEFPLYALPASAPVIPVGSVNIGRDWIWLDECATFAAKLFQLERIYAVTDSGGIEAVVVIRDRVPHILSPDQAESLLETGSVITSGIQAERFSVTDREDTGLVANVQLRAEHSSDISADFAMEIAGNFYSWLYPLAVGPLPQSENVFAEAFGLHRLPLSHDRPVWYRPDIGPFSDDEMAWSRNGDPQNVHYMREIAPEGVTVLSERLVLVERPNGSHYAVGLVDPGPATYQQLAQRKLQPVVFDTPSDAAANWFAGGDPGRLLDLLKRQALEAVA